VSIPTPAGGTGCLRAWCFGGLLRNFSPETAGLLWGALFAWTGSLVPGILSHALWDVLMFVLVPLQ